MDKVKKLKNGAIVLGLVMIGIGLYLSFLAYQISMTVIMLGIGTVWFGLIYNPSKTSEKPNRNLRSYLIDVRARFNSEGGRLTLIGLVSGFSGLGLGFLTLLYIRNLIYLFISVVLFLGGTALSVVGAAMVWLEWNEQRSGL